jgi:hypothetical protein
MVRLYWLLSDRVQRRGGSDRCGLATVYGLAMYGLATVYSHGYCRACSNAETVC